MIHKGSPINNILMFTFLDKLPPIYSLYYPLKSNINERPHRVIYQIIYSYYSGKQFFFILKLIYVYYSSAIVHFFIFRKF